MHTWGGRIQSLDWWREQDAEPACQIRAVLDSKAVISVRLSISAPWSAPRLPPQSAHPRPVVLRDGRPGLLESGSGSRACEHACAHLCASRCPPLLGRFLHRPLSSCGERGPLCFCRLGFSLRWFLPLWSMSCRALGLQ